MTRNERTSARVAKIAAKVLASSGRRPALMFTAKGREWYLQWHELDALAASALTQTADKYDNRGFDPREGGELEGRWRPKSAQVRRALRGKLGKRT